MNNRNDDRLQAAFDTARNAARRVPTADQQARARAQFLVEAKTVSLNGDMRHREQTGTPSVSELSEGERRMNRLYSRPTRLIAAVMLGVILAGGFWATPSLRALAQEIIDYFTPRSSDTLITQVPAEGGPRPVAANPFPLTIDDLAAQADFARLPTYIPAAYQFEGADYQDDQQIVTLRYICDTVWPLTIIEQRTDTPVSSQEVGASANIEDVPIRDTVGQYVRGAWEAMVNEIGTAEPSDQGPVISVPRVWTNTADWQHLVWREDGINFLLASGGFIGQIDATSCALAKDDFAAVAQGLEPASTLK